MANTNKTIFLDTNKLPRVKTPEGEVTEILNKELVNARNVFGALRWLKSGEKFTVKAENKHQLVYLMEGSGKINLQNKEHEVSKGMGLYLAPSESATVQAGEGASLKLFYLTVPPIPKDAKIV